MKPLKAAQKSMFSIQEAKVRRITSQSLSTPVSQRHSDTPKTTARSSEFFSPRQISPASLKAEETDLAKSWPQQAVMVRLALQEGLIDLMTKFGLSTAADRLHGFGRRLEKCMKSVNHLSKKKTDVEVSALNQKIATLTRLLNKQKHLNTKLAADNEDLRTELDRKGQVERQFIGLQEEMSRLGRTYAVACTKLEQAGKVHAEVKKELETLRNPTEPRKTHVWDERMKALQLHSAKLKLQLSVKTTALQKSKESLGEVHSTLSEVTQRLLASETLQQGQTQRVQECETQIGDLTLQVIALTSQIESEAALAEQNALELAQTRLECELLKEREVMVREDIYVQVERRERSTLSRVHALELIGLVRPKLVASS